ncbi:MAG: hypothetical protein RLZZ443_150 [Actinomycetota bacterium]
MTCPKCEAEMRNYERNGIVIDQCTGCRGVFLDRGELEHLLDAEAKFNAAPAAPAAAPMPTAQPQMRAPQQQYVDPSYHYPKKKKSFLSEILDFD